MDEAGNPNHTKLRWPSRTSRTMSREHPSARAISRSPQPSDSLRRISSNRRTVMLGFPISSTPSCGPTKVAGSATAARNIGRRGRQAPRRRPRRKSLENGPLADLRRPPGASKRRSAGGPPTEEIGWARTQEIRWSSTEEILHKALAALPWKAHAAHPLLEVMHLHACAV